MRRAVTQFRESLRLEPTYAPALAGVSSAYALALYYKYDLGVSAHDLAALSLLAADSAIALDPDFANGYAARGYIAALAEIDAAAAQADFDRATTLAPNAPNAPSWSSRVLAQKGRVEDAYAAARRARDLDPVQAGRRMALASLAFQLGDYEVTIRESREALRLQPELKLATAFAARALVLTGRGVECLGFDLGAYRLVRSLCLHAEGRTPTRHAPSPPWRKRPSGPAGWTIPTTSTTSWRRTWRATTASSVTWGQPAVDRPRLRDLPHRYREQDPRLRRLRPVRGDAFDSAVARIRAAAIQRVREVRQRLDGLPD